MGCKRIIYYPDNMVKTHFVHPDCEEETIRNIKEEYTASPVSIFEDESMKLDPGGMISMSSIPYEKDFDGFKVSIKPEHVYYGIKLWQNKRDCESGSVIVFFGKLYCYVVPEDLYKKIGVWLISLKCLGESALREMSESLKGYVEVPVPAKKELEEF